jgi:hypothetical protein
VTPLHKYGKQHGHQYQQPSHTSKCLPHPVQQVRYPRAQHSTNHRHCVANRRSTRNRKLSSAHVIYSAWRGVQSPPLTPPFPQQTGACHKRRPLNSSHVHIYSVKKRVSSTPPATITHTRLLGCAGRGIYAVQVRHLAEKLVHGIHKLVVVRRVNLHTGGVGESGYVTASGVSCGQRYQTTTLPI